MRRKPSPYHPYPPERTMDSLQSMPVGASPRGPPGRGAIFIHAGRFASSQVLKACMAAVVRLDLSAVSQ